MSTCLIGVDTDDSTHVDQSLTTHRQQSFTHWPPPPSVSCPSPWECKITRVSHETSKRLGWASTWVSIRPTIAWGHKGDCPFPHTVTATFEQRGSNEWYETRGSQQEWQGCKLGDYRWDGWCLHVTLSSPSCAHFSRRNSHPLLNRFIYPTRTV